MATSDRVRSRVRCESLETEEKAHRTENLGSPKFSGSWLAPLGQSKEIIVAAFRSARIDDGYGLSAKPCVLARTFSLYSGHFRRLLLKDPKAAVLI
jgi:hypothetical protein